MSTGGGSRSWVRSPPSSRSSRRPSPDGVACAPSRPSCSPSCWCCVCSYRSWSSGGTRGARDRVRDRGDRPELRADPGTQSNLLRCHRGDHVGLLVTGLLAVITTWLAGFPPAQGSDQVVYLQQLTNGSIDLSGLLLAAVIFGDSAAQRRRRQPGGHGRRAASSGPRTLGLAALLADDERRCLPPGRHDQHARLRLPRHRASPRRPPRAQSANITAALSTEAFAVEVIRTIVAAVGVLAAVPVTTAIAVRWVARDLPRDIASGGSGSRTAGSLAYRRRRPAPRPPSLAIPPSSDAPGPSTRRRGPTYGAGDSVAGGKSTGCDAGADATGGDPPGVGVGVGAGGGSITSSSVSTTRSGSQRSLIRSRHGDADAKLREIECGACTGSRRVGPSAPRSSVCR